jgi:polysaccharide chain length determinant protein (PEP-CTERM system associated)
MTFDLSFYRSLLLRRLPIMAVFVLLFSGLGLVTASRLPNTYSTSARLLVEEPLIPDSMVTPTVRISVVEQLEIIEQRLMTRANLIDIANKFTVFDNIRDMDPDSVVTAMRNATTIQRPRAGRSSERASLMVISFDSHSPQVAAAVVNEYVTLVLQENTVFREIRAENTLNFFEQEVERLNIELGRQSAAIASFMAENANALPEGQAFRMSRQSLLQERLGQIERDLRMVEQRRTELIETFENTGTVSQSSAEQQRSAYEEQLIVSKAELETLEADYSAENPRVLRLKDRIARLEAIISAEKSANNVPDGADEASTQQSLFNVMLAELDVEASELEALIQSTKNELNSIQRDITRTATNGIQLAELEREYEVIQTRYRSAINNLNTARLSERLESTAQGQRISVLESAIIPRSPSGPDRPLIAGSFILAGFALAVGYFVLLEFLNRLIRRPLDLIEHFGTEPITVIPYMESTRERVLRRVGLITATLIATAAVPAGLWYVDTYYLPLEFIVQEALARLSFG